MRTKLNLRPAYVAGALTLAIPTSALALAQGQSQADSAPQLTVSPQRIHYGGEVTVSGNTATADSGQQLVLVYQQPGAQWRPIAYTNVQGDGSFRFVTRLQRSGQLNVLSTGGATTVTAAATTGAVQSAAVSGVNGTPLAGTTPQPVSVGAKLVVPKAPINVLSGQTADVRGRLVPGLAGRTVQLDGRSGGSWHKLVRARTAASGRFDLRFLAGNLGSQRLRVRFGGDGTNGPASAPSALFTVYRPSGASWYDDSGGTACGFHATMGVANRTLPCGTHVTFEYGGHQVAAVVDDRGPFVDGRDWDLNQNTAAALGFSGVDTVWSSV
jgi:rare lipoprotein A